MVFITIVPSPYQRDLFGALAARREVELDVYYMEAASPDSPWPEKPLRDFEHILPGRWFEFGAVRSHLNWRLPDVSDADVIVISGITALTSQWLMRRSARGKRWLFWGERLRGNTGLAGVVQRSLAHPLSRADGIVGISRAAVDDYRRRFPDVRQFCIPYHCDLADFLAIDRARDKAGPVTFLFCGQMIRRKGIDLLLAAFDRLVEGGADASLLLVGREAELPEVLSTVGSAARARIRYEGFQPPERLAHYFSVSDVFVLPSRYDGWGVVINQALGAGLPIISSDAAGAGQDFVENGTNGMCVPAGDAEALYNAMLTIVSKRELIDQWGAQSRKKAHELTPEAGAEKWVNVFADVLRPDRREAPVELPAMRVSD